jgi:glycosyltransferase involved in cell wall biosynthesis
VQPLVTIIIPAFNGKARLLRAIGSVLQQKYRPVEIVIVDEGSTPGIDEALAEQDVGVRLRILRSSGPLGAAAARNKGIAAAAGEYIAFFEANDHWLPSKLAKQVTTAVGHCGGAGIVVYTQTEIRDRDRPAAGTRRAIGESEKVADYLFANGGCIDPATVLVSTKLARKVLYRPELRQHEDWDWYIRLEQQGAKFRMVPEPLCISGGYDTQSDSRVAWPDLSLVALETWKPLISTRAYFAFRATIAPHMRNKALLPAFAMIVEAYVRGAIESRLFVVLLRRLVQPERLGTPPSNGAAVRSNSRRTKLSLTLPRVTNPRTSTSSASGVGAPRSELATRPKSAARGQVHHGEL